MAIFECIASGHPSPTIQWEKLQSTVFPHTAKVLSSGALVIDPVTSDEGGVYRCLAHNSEGEVFSDVRLDIKGNYYMQCANVCISHHIWLKLMSFTSCAWVCHVCMIAFTTMQGHRASHKSHLLLLPWERRPLFSHGEYKTQVYYYSYNYITAYYTFLRVLD